MPLVKRSITPHAISRGHLTSVGVAGAGPINNELELTTNGGLACVVLQLSSLSRHVEDMFAELHRETVVIFHRTCLLGERVERLKVKITQLNPTVEEVLLQDINMRKPFKSSVIKDQQIITLATRPVAINEVYLRCEPPPDLQKLNPYRLDGKDSLKFYTDDGYFFELWRIAMQKESKSQMKRHKRTRQPQYVTGENEAGKSDRSVVQKIPGSVTENTTHGGRLLGGSGNSVGGGNSVEIVQGGRMVIEKTLHNSVRDNVRRDPSVVRNSQISSEPGRKQQQPQQQQQQSRKVAIQDHTPIPTRSEVAVVSIAGGNSQADSSGVRNVVGSSGDNTVKEFGTDVGNKSGLNIANEGEVQQNKDDVKPHSHGAGAATNSASKAVAHESPSQPASYNQTPVCVPNDQSTVGGTGAASPLHVKPSSAAAVTTEANKSSSPLPTSPLTSASATTPSKSASSNRFSESSSSSSIFVPPPMAGVPNQFIYDATVTATKTSTPDSTTPDFPLPPSPPPAFGPALSLDSPIPLPPPPPTPPAEEKTPNHVPVATPLKAPSEMGINSSGEMTSNMSAKKMDPLAFNGNGMQRYLEPGGGVGGGLDDIVSIASSGSFATVSSAGSGGGAAVSRGKESGSAGPGGATGQTAGCEDDLVRDTRSDLLSAIREGIQLRKVEERRQKTEKKHRQPGRLDVQTIMETAFEMRRKALEDNDSEEGEEEEDELDGNWSDGD